MCEIATQPEPQPAQWWQQRHQAKLLEKATRQQEVELVFLGDSITQGWERADVVSTWNKFYQPRGALNLGFDGDRTEHLLWRIEQGELDGLSPKLVVLLIGTNNTGHRLDEAKETVAAIHTIIQAIQAKLPDTKILLLALFPRSAKPSQRLRVINDAINQKLTHCADNERVFYLDINHRFLTEDGWLTADVMPDFLHLHPEQYRVWAEAMEPTITALLEADLEEASH